MINEKTVEYIKKMLEAGATEEIIKTNLSNSGFDSQTINDSFKKAFPVVDIVPPTPQRNNVLEEIASAEKIEVERSNQQPVKEIVREPSIFSPYSIILSVALLMCLTVIGHQVFADMETITNLTSRLAAEGVVIVPIFAISLLAAGLIGSKKKGYQVLIFPYVVISGILFLKLFFNIISFLYDKNATVGFYIAIVLIVALLTGVGIFFQARSHKNK